jgi:hypothetical protein
LRHTARQSESQTQAVQHQGGPCQPAIKREMFHRPRKSPVEPAAEGGAGDASSAKSRASAAPYYDDRYRERRDRDPPPADRDRDRDHRRDPRH